MNYIKRHLEGIEINKDSGDVILNISLKKHINELCLKNMSTYDGRREALSLFLNENNNIPIYVDRNMFLYPTKSIRVYDTVFINFYEVLSIKKVDNRHTKFIFTNLYEKTLEISFNKTMKQHRRIGKILEYLNYRN